MSERHDPVGVVGAAAVLLGGLTAALAFAQGLTEVDLLHAFVVAALGSALFVMVWGLLRSVERGESIEVTTHWGGLGGGLGGWRVSPPVIFLVGTLCFGGMLLAVVAKPAPQSVTKPAPKKLPPLKLPPFTQKAP